MPLIYIVQDTDFFSLCEYSTYCFCFPSLVQGLRSNLERSKVNTEQERDMNMVHRRDKEQGKGHKRVPDMAKDMVPGTVMDTNKEHRLDMASGRRKMSGMTPASDPMR